MSFWLVVLQVWNAINSYADWNSYKLVKPLQLTRFCLNFSPFRKKKKCCLADPPRLCGVFLSFAGLKHAITQNYCAGMNMAEWGGKAGRKCKVLFLLFNPDWQVPSAGAVTHPRLPCWRRLLAAHQSTSRAFKPELTRTFPWAGAVFLVLEPFMCRMSPSLREILDKLLAICLQVEKGFSWHLWERHVLSGASCPPGAGWRSTAEVCEGITEQKSFSASSFLCL